jgi:hypothetical protein
MRAAYMTPPPGVSEGWYSVKEEGCIPLQEDKQFLEEVRHRNILLLPYSYNEL